ncbi:HNH endonuclease [Cryptosporangium japonicum]|uniref:HNH endonuclease n=1 Tax=Cryptosporangium japonicum TaxID=80872 RepID=A0ABN0V8T2_9ACTN
MFTGVLDRASGGLTRGEQSLLRGAAEADCALCGSRYPASLLRAAHIKRRAVCSDDERRDLANIAMLAGVMGCDALFELGYLTVDSAGTIQVAASATGALRTQLDALAGRAVPAHRPSSADYFAWHRATIFDPGKAQQDAERGR